MNRTVVWINQSSIVLCQSCFPSELVTILCPGWVCSCFEVQHGPPYRYPLNHWKRCCSEANASPSWWPPLLCCSTLNIKYKWQPTLTCHTKITNSLTVLSDGIKLLPVKHISCKRSNPAKPTLAPLSGKTYIIVCIGWGISPTHLGSRFSENEKKEKINNKKKQQHESL